MAIHVMRSIGFNYGLMGVGPENSVMLFFKTKYLNINFQLRLNTGVQALPALQAELALQGGAG
jgi:hypothetical protein